MQGSRARHLLGRIRNVTLLVSHDRSEETPEAKARWFRSLPIEERMRLLVEFTNLALHFHPELKRGRDARPIAGRVQVLERP
jgi:hypothetical protein